ncbi:threonine synthase [Coralloluteibacterium thermophilus]|uniref:Threonine synthase n=1 Tax=Coralloluteibacterium thermophilum TaxID=2707049 RepID=A0ABV9NJ04_9GAMM
MRFLSTRGGVAPTGLSAALAAGLAPDGGLFVPERVPRLDPAGFPEDASLAATAAHLLAPFFEGDPLAGALDAVCAEAFAIAAPLRPLRGAGDFVLELFHGPTAAFKDFGARFLAACLERMPRDPARPLTVLVATSGDTGAAVAGAFHGREGMRVLILYPEGRVSPRQAQGLEAWGGNVRALRVAGSFDDCQRMVKAALADPALRARHPLGSANSISLGRWLPQAAYYAHAALGHWRTTGRPLGFVVPTGNLGNALAALLARRMGLPVGDIVLACNANRVLPDFFAGGAYVPVPSVATLANAMDVGAPSNFERLCWLEPDVDALRAALRAVPVDDAAIRDALRAAPARHGLVACPHTACALHALDAARAAGEGGDRAVVATAHPAKFESIVEPLVGHAVPVPPALAALLARPAQGMRVGTGADVIPAALDAAT